MTTAFSKWVLVYFFSSFLAVLSLFPLSALCAQQFLPRLTCTSLGHGHTRSHFKPLFLRMSAKMPKIEDISQTFCLFSCCRQRCWCHWSCHFFSVSIPHSPCCPSVTSNHKQGTISQTTNQSTTVPAPVILSKIITCIWQTVISQSAIHRLPLQ